MALPNFYNVGDQAIYQGGQHFIPQEQYRLGYKPPITEEDQTTTSGTGVGIPYTGAFTGGGGGGGGGDYDYEKTWTREGRPLEATWQGDYDVKGNKINELGRTGILGIKDKVTDFFSKFNKPRYRGELGDRLEGQYQTGQKLPFFLSKAAGLQSPFNPKSGNYNPNFADQLNYLEAGTGGRWTGTGDDLTWTGDQMMMGRDPQSGLLKYGAGSVLAGKNVFSGFGTNDYEQALQDYIAKMEARGKKRQLTAFQRKKIKQAQEELGGITTDDQRRAEEYRAKQDTPGILYNKEKAAQNIAADTKAGAFIDTIKTDPGTGGGGSQASWKGQTAAKERQGVQVAGPGGGQGSYFKEGGRAGFQGGGGPAGGASAGGDYGGNVNPEQEYAGRTFQDTYGGDVSNQEEGLIKKLNISPVMETADTDLGWNMPTGKFGLESLSKLGKLKAMIDFRHLIESGGAEAKPEFSYQGKAGPIDINATYSDDAKNINASIRKGNLTGGIGTDFQGNYNLGFDYKAQLPLGWWQGNNGGLVSIL